MMSLYADWSLTELKGFRKELAKALASGAMSVRFADRQIQYRSVAEMERTAAILDGEIASREGTRRVRMLRVDSQKGFC